MKLIVSISGIRGIVGQTLTPDVIVNYSAAFAEYCNRKPIVLGRDGRITGKIVGNLVASTLLSMGCDVIALGVVPTPTVQIAVEKFRAGGGISITASHNPMEWNGLKFIGGDGIFLNGEENRRLWDIADRQAWNYEAWNKTGNHSTVSSFIERHIDLVLRLPYIKLDSLRQRKFKVVVDCINAAGGAVVPILLRNLGCEVIELNCEVSGVFSHTPEPIPQNLTDLCSRVRESKADLGIAVDPDVDRLVFVTEKGEPFSEENTIAGVVDFILNEEAKRPAGQRHNVVVNLSTTRAVDDIASNYGAEVLRSPVGEINVVEKMKQCGAIVGGEGSGGVILTQAHLGRDALVGIGLMLQHLANTGGSLSELKAAMPQYSIVKDKIILDHKPASDIFTLLADRFSGKGKITTDDGLKIDFPESWVHLRTSNTEPIIRIIAEAHSGEEAGQLVHEFKQTISKMV